MAKVTSKLQVTIPKAIATRHGIEPGDDVEWADAGDAIRLEPVEKRSLRRVTVEDRLKWFDDATERQRLRESAAPIAAAPLEADRGWTREELYSRGSPG
jgi:AbrB family looped-hinge helix DNA binding protein